MRLIIGGSADLDASKLLQAVDAFSIQLDPFNDSVLYPCDDGATLPSVVADFCNARFIKSTPFALPNKKDDRKHKLITFHRNIAMVAQADAVLIVRTSMAIAGRHLAMAAKEKNLTVQIWPQIWGFM